MLRRASGHNYSLATIVKYITCLKEPFPSGLLTEMATMNPVSERISEVNSDE